MKKQHTLAGLCILVLGSILLAACGGQPSAATATPDPNLIVTEAFLTVQAGMALTQAVLPTATETPTVQPTNTMDPTMAAGMTATSQAVTNPLLPTNTTVALTPVGGTPAAGTTPGVGTTPPAATTPQVVPTATSGAAAPPPANTSGDKCEWVSNSPADNSVLKKNASYDATIVVKNSGTTTWSNKYALRFFGGERMGIPTDFYVQREVKPGENYSFIFTITMPNSTGKKEALMVVQNAEGSTMCWINLPIDVQN